MDAFTWASQSLEFVNNTKNNAPITEPEACPTRLVFDIGSGSSLLGAKDYRQGSTEYPCDPHLQPLIASIAAPQQPSLSSTPIDHGTSHISTATVSCPG